MGPSTWATWRFPKVTIQYGEALQFAQVPNPTNEQADQASLSVFERISELHDALRAQRRRGVLRTLRDRQHHGAAVTG